jgi:hypothetical protein
MGGPMAVDVLNAVITGIPFGRCRGYLLRLQAAAQAAGEQAHWLLPHIYGPDRRRAQHEASAQLAQIARILRRAAAAAPADVCRLRQTTPKA